MTRAVGQAAYDAGNGALHAGNGDDDRGAHDGLRMGQKPVNAGHAHIVEPLHPVAQKFCGLCRLFGHRQVAGAGGEHHHGADAARFRQGADAPDAAGGIIVQLHAAAYHVRRLGAHAGDEDGLLAPGEHVFPQWRRSAPAFSPAP